ncbi:MAG TPA: lytic transglycosylase domain-containing protein [Caulobacteraceae bacterium]|nr:lytic transglycosylase domain-containing protein [Caulobacteraceae bacterium]
MSVRSKGFRAAVSAVAALALLVQPAFAGPPQALSQADAAIYQAAFAAVRNGDFKTADKRLRKADDKSLIGYVQLEKLMHRAHQATFGELSSWLSKYGDLPGAERVFALAQKRQPAKAASLSAPPALDLLQTVANDGVSVPGMPSPAARQAFYSGDVETAFKLAAQSSERWIAGLSAFRLGKFADARSFFDAVAIDETEDEWLRAGAAFWAARSVIAEGSPEYAPAYLQAAAQKPWTFYGMLAEAQLGMEPQARFDATPLSSLRPYADAMTSMLIKVATAPTPVSAKASYADMIDCADLVRTDPRARRAAALIQIGRTTEAMREVELGLAEAKSAGAKAQWSALAQQLTPPVDRVRPAPSQSGFDPADFPAPKLDPKDGFTLDPALVYAIVRQESRFNPDAHSRAGAVGLMQVMPETAAMTTGDDNYRRIAKSLRDPSTNLRVGQDYFAWLLAHGVGNDLLAAVAAYNGGPGSPLKTAAQLGTDADSLMLIESLPAQETRAYVEKVMANYWLYRREFGAKSPSLDTLASGHKVSATIDQAVSLPSPTDVALAATTAPTAIAD